MARVARDEDEGLPPGEAMPDYDLQFMRQAQDAMTALGGDEAMAYISRRNDKGRLQYAGELPLAEVVQRGASAIREMLGGGQFSVRFQKGLEISGTSTIYIEGEPIIPPTKPPVAPGPIVQDVARLQGGGAPDTMAMLKEIIQENAKATERLILALAGNKPSKDDDDIFDKAIRIAELMKPAQAAPSLSEDGMMNLITKGMELAQKATGGRGGDDEGGGGDGEDSVTGLLRVFQPTIHEIVQKKLLDPPPVVATAVTPAIPARVPPKPAPTAEAEPAPTEPAKGPTPVTPIWMIHLRPYLKELLALARDARDPDLYSEVLLDRLPDGVYDELKAFAEREDFVTTVCENLPPEFAPYPAYMKRFVTLVKEKITAPESPLADEDEDDDGGGSDMG